MANNKKNDDQTAVFFLDSVYKELLLAVEHVDAE